MNFIIRKATANDAEGLHELYFKHLTENPPKAEQDMEKWRSMLSRFEEDKYYNLLVGEIDGKIISSVTLIVIENLTHNLRPYGVIENVVTHSEYRGRGYASKLIQYASGIAEKFGCYKIMLLTGSKRESVLGFYEKNGFDRNVKTAFLKKL